MENLLFSTVGKTPLLNCGKIAGGIFRPGEISDHPLTRPKNQRRFSAPAFQKQAKPRFFLRKYLPCPLRLYLTYNRRKKLVLKTRWKKWKNPLENLAFPPGNGGKPGGKG
ncbi:MAG: hypothetical protein H9864_02830 [Candidatus Faecalibacterium intestinavium]|uniref:Uncharacterized protein n=1 Tax=Candidatus Faecalibacterium intestinavium TaxID=2838580 RepID=A0A9E2KJX5_9FIRM|nr:hypothetical protein [Candidatus Faecalibacterium intestinavium]